MQEILIGKDLRWIMYSQLMSVLLVAKQSCKTPWRFQQLSQKIWLQLRSNGRFVVERIGRDFWHDI